MPDLVHLDHFHDKHLYMDDAYIVSEYNTFSDSYFVCFSFEGRIGNNGFDSSINYGIFGVVDLYNDAYCETTDRFNSFVSVGYGNSYHGCFDSADVSWNFGVVNIDAYLQKPDVDSAFKRTDFGLDMKDIGKSDNDYPYYVISYEYKQGVVTIRRHYLFHNHDLYYHRLMYNLNSLLK